MGRTKATVPSALAFSVMIESASLPHTSAMDIPTAVAGKMKKYVPNVPASCARTAAASAHPTDVTGTLTVVAARMKRSAALVQVGSLLVALAVLCLQILVSKIN